MKPVIQVINVSKSFTNWMDRPHDIKKILINLMRGKLEFGQKSQVTILDNVTFNINEGEFVGIMGKNGVGKSTLLKLLSGIYSPDQGIIRTSGRIAPLLELGAGFSDELTGYENIFLNAAILGYGRKKTYEKLNEIIEFTELGDHIYKPIRNYSSGMVVRLGFSIATHLESQILFFDEVLSVGDIWFQQKCINKIKELHSNGKTIILVSHSPDQIRNYCTRCLVFNKSKLEFDGSADEGASCYENLN
ncbi:MAG: ABC transporter ATP-binding protein [Deltaproteobacteria bacterium]|nr:ABC transporter ATP-binding protein [Deltaproteobacteria bacterium]